MDTESVIALITDRKLIKRIGNEVWFPVVTCVEPKRRQVLAIASLNRYSRD